MRNHLNGATVRRGSTVITNQCKYCTQTYDTGSAQLSHVSVLGSDRQYCSSLCTDVECQYTTGHLSASFRGYFPISESAATFNPGRN